MILNDERAEYWRRSICEAVASAAKHGAAEKVDIEINNLLLEVLKAESTQGRKG